LHSLAKTHASFDDPNLVSHAGLVPVMALAQRAGLGALIAEHAAPGGECGVNAHLKVPCLVAGMAAGADSIDDMGLLRHGAAIAAIGEDTWTAIKYPRAIWNDQLDAWISDAEVAETEYTAFASKKGQAVTARLIVRRVRDLNKKAAAGQDELFPVWRYHAVFTDSPFELIQAEGQHRDHAVIEQVFADVISGPLAHLPSGAFAANAAWLSIAAMAHNLVRAAGALASLPFAKARAATIRRALIAVAGRTARHGRGHLTLHLPEGWHREHEWLNLLTAACGPPATAA
jgi:hypothetical protein